VRRAAPGLAIVAAMFALGCRDERHAASVFGAGGAAATGGAGGRDAAGPGTRVLAARSAMLFDGPACTGDVGATGDRWCGFLALSSANTRNLFVVNVSQVVAGVAVDCAATRDPNCLLLTPALGGDSADPTLHGTLFQGDTLVYYDAALVPHAWRPGMSAGRRLVDASASLDAVFCTPAPRGTAVICIGLPAEQPDVALVRAELLAGNVDAAAPEPLLATLDAVIVSNTADRGGRQRFSFGFPHASGVDYLAWTSRATATGPEILKLQPVADAGARTVVASDVHGWDVSADGTRWLWLRAIDAFGVGTLQTAQFPDGGATTDVLANVIQYGLPRASGDATVALTSAGTLFAIAEPAAAPASRLLLDAGVRMLFAFGAQGHVAFVKNVVGANFIDLHVRKPDGSGACAVDTSAGVPFASVHFAPDGGALLWAQRKTGGFDGHYTRLVDCASMPLAPDVVALGTIGERILFMDGFDEASNTGTMRFRTVAADHALAATTPTLISAGVDSYAISGPAPGALVYTVNAGSADDGVYVRGL
jgi:hypothetical protein